MAEPSDVSRPARSGSSPSRSPSLKAGLLAILGRFPVQSQPTVLALLFALLAWPLVALTLGAVDTTQSCSRPAMLPISDAGRWVAAASAVFISALVASSVTSRLVKNSAFRLAPATVVLALLVAIPALPLLPALLGQHVGAGAFQGFDCWEVPTNSQNLSIGLQADLLFPLAPIVEPIPVLILVIGVSIWAGLVTKSRRGSPIGWPLLASVVALGAVDVVVALGAVIVSSLPIGVSGGPSDVGPAPTAASPAGTPVAVAGISWTPYLGPGAGTPIEVVPGGPGYVGLCLNTHYGANGNYGYNVYCESPDGLTWTEASFPGLENAKGELQWLGSVARGPQGLVLVGYRTHESRKDLPVPFVFTSPDGRTWSQSPPGGPDYEVVNGPAGFVGIAWGGYLDGISVMQSADGVSWRESDLDGVYAPNSRLAKLSATSAAYFIAVGSETPDFRHRGLYRSVDGLHWAQVTIEDAPIGRVVEAPDGSLLTQIRGLPSHPTNYILMRSVDDGVNWEPVDVQVTGMTWDEDDSAIDELTRVGNVVLATSHHSVLASVDGIRWQVASPSAITDNEFSLTPLGDLIRLDIGEHQIWIGRPTAP